MSDIRSIADPRLKELARQIARQQVVVGDVTRHDWPDQNRWLKTLEGQYDAREHHITSHPVLKFEGGEFTRLVPGSWDPSDTL